MDSLGHRRPLYTTALVIGDLLVGLLGWKSAFWTRILFPLPFTRFLLPLEKLQLEAHLGPLVAIGQLLLLYLVGLYDPPAVRPRLEIARRVSASLAIGVLLAATTFFLLDRAFPRSVILLYALVELPLLVAWRSVAQRFVRPRIRRVVIVGIGQGAEEVASEIDRHHWHGLQVAGYVIPPDESAGDRAVPEVLGPHLGAIEDLPALLADGTCQDIILAPETRSWRTEMLDRLAGARPAGTSVLLLPGPFESLVGRMRYRWVRDLPLIDVIRETEWLARRPRKRLFDLLFGTLLFLLATPALLAVALAVRLGSRGPVLYRQTRIGRHRVSFTLFKFRTMHLDAESDGEERLATEGDPRMTRLGAVLRSYRLDELPQLWNVLVGQMSLVGPRPERPGFVDRYLAEVPGYAERFSLPPGLTGLAQVNGDYHSSPENKLRYDLAYLANQSLWLDLSILFRTVKIVLTSKGV